MIKRILIIAVLLLLAFGLYREQETIAHWLYSQTSPAAPINSRPRSLAAKVITQDVILTSNDIVFEAIGTGRARLSVQIYPAVTGEVSSVNFQAQDKVGKNDVLVQLDNEKEKLAVRLAEVKLKGVRNLLSRYEQAVKDGAVPESEVDSARADVDAAQVALEQAVQSSARSFEQAEQLYQSDLSSFLDVVDAQYVLASAEQQLANERTIYATQIATLFRVLDTDLKGL